MGQKLVMEPLDIWWWSLDQLLVHQMEYPHTRIPHMDTPLDNLPKQGLFGHIILMWLIFVQFWIVLTSHGHDFLASLNWTTQSSSQILLPSHLSMHRPHLLPCSSIQAFQWSFSFFLSEQTQIGFGQSTQPWMQSMSQGQSEYKIKNFLRKVYGLFRF